MRRTSLAVFLVGLLAACGSQPVLNEAAGPSSATPGSPVPTSAEVLGNCPYGPEVIIDADPLFQSLPGAVVWARVDKALPPAEETSPLPPTPLPNGFVGSVRVPGTAVTYLSGPAQSFLSFAVPTLELVRSEIGSGRTVTLGINARGGVTLAVADRADGTAPFIGFCEQKYATEPFARMVTAAYPGRAPADVLRAISTNPAVMIEQLVTRSRPLPPPLLPTWEQSSPWERQIDPASTPAAVFATLRSASYRLEVPKDWIGADVALCTHSSIGWNGCSALARPFATDPAVDHMTARYVKGEDLTFWVVGPSADFRGQRQQIGVIPAEVLLAHPDDEIDLTTSPDRPDGPSLAAHLSAGTDPQSWVVVRP